jgi:hypothetical protein
MIDDAFAYIRREVVNHLGVADTEVIAGKVHALKEDGAARGLQRDVSLAGRRSPRSAALPGHGRSRWRWRADQVHGARQVCAGRRDPRSTGGGRRRRIRFRKR